MLTLQTREAHKARRLPAAQCLVREFHGGGKHKSCTFGCRGQGFGLGIRAPGFSHGVPMNSRGLRDCRM